MLNKKMGALILFLSLLTGCGNFGTDEDEDGVLGSGSFFPVTETTGSEATSDQITQITKIPGLGSQPLVPTVDAEEDWLAYIRLDESAVTTLVVESLIGTTILEPAGNDISDAVISGDGSVVLFEKDSQVFIFSIGGNEVAQLSSLDEFPLDKPQPSRLIVYSIDIGKDRNQIAYSADLFARPNNNQLVGIFNGLDRDNRILSVNKDGDPADDIDVGSVSIADNGTIAYTVLDTGTADLIAGNDDDTDGVSDIYIYDGNSHRRVTKGAGGDSYNPSISADGRFLAFESVGGNLVPGDSNGAEDVFLMDLDTGQVSLVSVDNDGNQFGSGGYGPTISRDGGRVAFASGDDGSTRIFSSGSDTSVAIPETTASFSLLTEGRPNYCLNRSGSNVYFPGIGETDETVDGIEILRFTPSIDLF